MSAHAHSELLQLTAPEMKRGDFAHFVELICRLYREATGRRCPWDQACGQNLKGALRRMRDWEMVDIERCVRFRFASHENALVSPKYWLPRLEEYAAGPLDRYHQVIAGYATRAASAGTDDKKDPDPACERCHGSGFQPHPGHPGMEFRCRCTYPAPGKSGNSREGKP